MNEMLVVPARAGTPQVKVVIAGHSASKTRVNALTTRQSIHLRKDSFAKKMDARVKPAHDPVTHAAAADLPIAAFTRGMTSSAISCIERLLSAGSTQSIPA